MLRSTRVLLSQGRLASRLSSQVVRVSRETTHTLNVEDLESESSEKNLYDSMRAFRDQVLSSSMDPYFHRLSNKMVLAVLEVEVEGKKHYVRGLNSEVSIPTGSICAERNAMAAARAQFPGLHRKDLSAVAVLQLPFGCQALSEFSEGGKAHINPIWPCGVCSEWFKKVKSVNSGFRILSFDSPEMKQVLEKEADDVEIVPGCLPRGEVEEDEESSICPLCTEDLLSSSKPGQLDLGDPSSGSSLASVSTRTPSSPGERN